MHPIRIGIPLVLIAVFIFYVFYLVIIKKDSKKTKSVLYPGLFFIAIWAIVFFLILR